MSTRIVAMYILSIVNMAMRLVEAMRERRVKIFVPKMMTQLRGYKLVERHKEAMIYLTMKTHFSCKYWIFQTGPTSDSATCMVVVFPTGQNFSSACVQMILELCEVKGCEHVIVVTDQSTTHPLTPKQMTDAVEMGKIRRWEHLTKRLFTFDRTVCVNNPVRVERIEPTAHIASVRDKLPVLLDTDPICRLYGFRAGDVIQTHSSSPDAGEIPELYCVKNHTKQEQ